MTTTLLLGIDVGTSDSKVLATTTDGVEIVVRSSPTRWNTTAGGLVDTDGITLADAVIALAAATVQAAAEQIGPVSVGGIAVTGMAETGVLLDANGNALTPSIAWFDRRGEDQLPTLPEPFRRQFPAVTGLPLGIQATLAKLLWFNVSGYDLTAGNWQHIPELIIHRLGAPRSAETSLLARTGLFDQGTGALWPEALELLGIDASFFPPRADAGSPIGIADGPHCPDELRGAALTVAGHDHPVAAVGCGAVGPGEVFDSFGTAQVYLLTLDEPVDPARRARLVAAGVNAVRHAVPGRWHLLAGTKGGLILRRTLALLGVTDERRRAELDTAALAVADTETADLVEVSGAANDDGILKVTAGSDRITPELLWLAAIRHGIEVSGRLLQSMSDEFGPPTAAVVAGGWTRMGSVRQEKQRALPAARFTDRAQAGAFGAAAFAAHAHRSAAHAGQQHPGPTQAELDRFTKAGLSTPIEETPT